MNCPICNNPGWSKVGPPHCRPCYDSPLGFRQRYDWLFANKDKFKDQDHVARVLNFLHDQLIVWELAADVPLDSDSD